MKETVKTLSDKFENHLTQCGNLQVVSGTVWNSKQIAEVFDRNNKGNCLVKMEITKGFDVGDTAINYIVLKYPPIK